MSPDDRQPQQGPRFRLIVEPQNKSLRFCYDIGVPDCCFVSTSSNPPAGSAWCNPLHGFCVCGGVVGVLNEAEAKRRRFDDFVTGEFENLLALALSTLRNEEDALDVAQETMSRVWSRWPEVERLDRPGAWARRVALNLVTDRLRSKGRRQRLLSRLHRQVPLASHDTVEERDEALWSAVKVLPTGQRDAVTLFYVLDLSVSKIAETLRVPEGTVKSDLSRARRRLRRQLEGSSNG